MTYLLIAANIAMLLTLALAFRTLPPVLPMFYSKPEGDTQLAVWWLILLIPVCMNSLFILNNTLTRKLFSLSDFANKIIWYANLVLITILTAVFIKIVTHVS